MSVSMCHMVSVHISVHVSVGFETGGYCFFVVHILLIFLYGLVPQQDWYVFHVWTCNCLFSLQELFP